MLICKSDDETSQDENESPKKKEKDKKYLWNHGSKMINVHFDYGYATCINIFVVHVLEEFQMEKF